MKKRGIEAIQKGSFSFEHVELRQTHWNRMHAHRPTIQFQQLTSYIFTMQEVYYSEGNLQMRLDTIGTIIY